MKTLITTTLICLGLMLTQYESSAQISATKKKDNRFGFKPVHELGITIGANQQRSDINNMYIIDFSSVNISAGMYYRYTFHHRFAIALTGTYHRLDGADRFVRDKEMYSQGWFRYIRNLSFRTDVAEVAVSGEFHILRYEPFNLRKMRWTPYVSAGVGGIYFNPKTEYNGEWISLQPIGTEGQGLAGYPAPYRRVTWAAPIRAGIKVNLTKFMSMQVHGGYTFTGTDYLDDVSTEYPVDFNDMSVIAKELSVRADEVTTPDIYGRITAPGEQRGDPTDKDGYWTLGTSVSFKIGKGNRKSSNSCVTWKH